MSGLLPPSSKYESALAAAGFGIAAQPEIQFEHDLAGERIGGLVGVIAGKPVWSGVIICLTVFAHKIRDGIVYSHAEHERKKIISKKIAAPTQRRAGGFISVVVVAGNIYSAKRMRHLAQGGKARPEFKIDPVSLQAVHDVEVQVFPGQLIVVHLYQRCFEIVGL